jgi:hypothetical protein
MRRVIGEDGRDVKCSAKRLNWHLSNQEKSSGFLLKDNLLASFVNQTQEKRDQLTAFDQTCFFWQSSIYEFQ